MEENVDDLPEKVIGEHESLALNRISSLPRIENRNSI
jgi:hypothetical protein